MSTQLLPLGQSVSREPQPQRVVSFHVLLSLYAIIPLCLLIEGTDRFFMSGALQAALPSSPHHFLVFQILLGVPHILASAITLTSNLEYVAFFKLKLLGMTAFIVLFFGVGSLFIPYKVLYIITALWTVHHVLKQQHGIARGIYQLPQWAFNTLLSLSVSAGAAIYIGIFLKNSLTPTQATLIQNTAGSLCMGLFLATLIVNYYYVKTSFGTLFLWANSLLVVSSFYLYMHHYYFLAILVPRLVHDATAFIFYVTHDINRHQQQPTNFIYRWASRYHIPIVAVLPCLSFGLAFVLQRYGDAFISDLTQYLLGVDVRKAVTLGLIGYLSLMHYYTEAFTWKQGSPYRRFIGFKK